MLAKVSQSNRHIEQTITIHPTKSMYEQMPNQVLLSIPVHKGSAQLPELSGKEGQ